MLLKTDPGLFGRGPVLHISVEDVYKRQQSTLCDCLTTDYYVFDIGSINVNKRQTIMCLTLAV